MKLCKDCQHVSFEYSHESGFKEYFCTVKGTLNLVDGSPYPAKQIRYDERQCGIMGRWWKERSKDEIKT